MSGQVARASPERGGREAPERYEPRTRSRWVGIPPVRPEPGPDQKHANEREKKLRKMMMLAMMLAMALMMAAPATAMADHLDDDDFVEEFCEDFDGDDFCDDEFEFDEFGFFPFFTPFFFEVEIDDIDCNGFDDDFDGLIDEDVVCVVEFDVDFDDFDGFDFDGDGFDVDFG